MGNSVNRPFEEEIKKEISENPVVVFTTNGCGYCVKAKKHLFNESVDYVEKNLTQLKIDNPEKFGGYSSTLMEMTKSRTVPQIFICGKFIGGCDDLENLIRRDSLIDMLELCSKEAVTKIKDKRNQFNKL
uniref:Glutaredoxin domain-containing protein n=1 Tax=Parastrongyloides trichosuri TaxID=131310 RepID=A0A0N4ZVK3_PARTI